jgi:O-antigen/teichoic acid export membrane protein
MIARGALFIMLSRVAFVLSGYAIHVSMAHLLTPVDYGIMGVILGLMTLWRVFLSAGVPQTATRLIAGDSRQTYWIWRKALKMQLLAAFVLWAVYVLGTPLWVTLLRDRTLWPYILASSPIIPLMAWYQVNLAYFAGRLQFARQAIVIGTYSIARVVFAVVLVVVGLRTHGVVLGLTLAALLVALGTQARIPREPEDGSPLSDWRGIVGFSMPLVVVSFGISALLNLDLLLLQRYFPQSEMIGYYNGAMNVGKAPYWVLSAFATTALPAVAQALSAGNRAAARRLVERHASYVLLISLPCAALVIPSGVELLALLYPEEYAVAADALVLLVCSGAALALLAVLTSAITAAGRPNAAMALVLGCTVLQCALAVALVPRFQMTGAALANLTTVSIGVLVAGWTAQREFGGVVELGRVSKGAAISIGLAAVVSLWRGYSPAVLPAVYCVGLLLYAGLMYAWGGWTESEIRSARRLVLRPLTAEPTPRAGP